MTRADLPIGARLAAAFAPVIVLMLAGTGVGLARLAALDEDLRRIVVERHGRAELVHAVIAEDVEILRAVQQLAIPGAADVAGELRRAAAARAKLGGLLEKLDAAYAGEGEEAKRLQQDAHDRHSRYLVSLTRLLRLAEAGRRDEARAVVLGTLRPQLDATLAAMRELTQLQTRLMAASVAAAGEAYRRARDQVIGVAAASCLLAALIGYLTARGIARPLEEAVRVAQRVAAGDLAVTVRAGGRSQTGRLLSALKGMNDGLAAIVGGVRSGSDAVATAARHLVAANEELAARTERHAAALEETAATMEEFAASAAQNASSAERAAAVARAAAATAVRGDEAIARAAEFSRAVREACGAIAEIVTGMDCVAAQTNIIALNAAVEAAHAGGGARGFAAVAAEIRSLAQRSAGAAAEAKARAAETVSAIEAGASLVEEARAALKDMRVAARDVAEIVGEIRAASGEQRAGIVQVSETLSQMDGMTQQNAALVAQVASAMKLLEEEARRLVEAVRAFDLGEDRSAVAAPVPRAAIPALPRLASTRVE